MTTFYEHIKAASSLASGTVWDLITHPKTGGYGGTILVADATATVADTPTSVLIPNTLVTATVATSSAYATVQDSTYAAYVPDAAGQGLIHDAPSTVLVPNNII